MKTVFKICSWVFVMAFCHLPAHAVFADEALKPRAEIGAQAGNTRSIATTELWIPLQQSTEDVLFADVRLMGDNHQNREGNIGVGYRRTTENNVLGKGVAGAHVWIDKRHTERGNQVYQATAGVEWLGEDVDLRANVYVPLSKKKVYSTPNTGQASAYLIGTGLYVDTLGTSYEEPQKGVDVEVGIPVKPLEKFYDSARVYAGGYYFDSENSDKVAGWRTRAAIDFTQDFSMGARIQRDHERGTQSFLEATVRFPFSHKKSYEKEGVRARLDESPVRDVDIVTGNEVASTGLAQPVVNTATGTQVTVLHVNNTAPGGGNGTAASPFNTLAAAQAAATAGSIIYVHTGNGTSAGQNAGITLSHAGQSLIGAGTGLVWDSDKFSTGSQFQSAPSNATIIAAGAAPVITNTAGNGVTVTADDVKISGVTVNGATARGIFASNVDDIKVNNVTISNNALTGIFIEAVGAGQTADNITIDNITASGNTSTAVGNYLGNDITLDVRNGGSMTDSRITNVTGTSTVATARHSVALHALDGGSFISPYVSDLSATGNGYLDTLDISSFESVYKTGASFTLSDATFSNLTANGTRWNAFGFYISNGTASNITVSGLNAHNVVYGAAYIYNDGGSIMEDVTMSDITVTGATTYNGLYFSTNDGGLINNLTISDANIQNTSREGITFEIYDYGAAYNAGRITNVNLDDISTTGSLGRDGLRVYIDDTHGSEFSGKVSNMVSTGNAGYGVKIDAISATANINLDLGGGTMGSTGNNSIHSNTLDDIYVDLNGGTLKAENNWWGVGIGLAPARITSVAGSTVDADPYLTAAP
ncbi:MAG: hypothetical protein EBQ96_06760 [Proteobacteria bacterium]|nr:hypothetical protein [Pseudomonadota bacterium]